MTAKKQGPVQDKGSDEKGAEVQHEPRVAFLSAATVEKDAVSGQIIIVCRQPNLRRGGIVHPAVAVYSEDAFSQDQLRSLKAEPLLEVLGVI